MSFPSPSATETGPKVTARDLRPDVQGFEPYIAGLTVDAIKERYGLSQVIKMASNENPLGTSPVVRQVLQSTAEYAFRYPQSGNPRLRQAIGARLGVSPEAVVTGNGSDELIDLLVRVRAQPGRDHVLGFVPTFAMYELQTRFHGAQFRTVPLKSDFGFDFRALAEAANENTALVFVPSPDNPTGSTALAEEMESLAQALPSGCLLVIDEAYIDFAQPVERYSLLAKRLREGRPLDNVVTLRTFSKMYGLAGVRLGFGVMEPWLADYLWRVRLPFSVNILAEAAGIAALEDDVHRQATLDTVLTGREWLTRELSDLGFSVFPSQANFILFRVGSEFRLDAGTIFTRLLEKGVIVRHVKSFGLPDCIRVSVGLPEENRIFLTALKAVLSQG